LEKGPLERGREKVHEPTREEGGKKGFPHQPEPAEKRGPGFLAVVIYTSYQKN